MITKAHSCQLEPNVNSSRSLLVTTLIGALLVALGGILRFAISLDELLWLDELHTSWAVHGSLAEVAGRAADGNQSPLFFWLTWISVNLFGQSELSTRLISVLASIGTMILSACLTWKWTRSGIAAAVVVWLIALDVQFLFYGTEARPYALIQCLSVAQVLLFWRAIEGRRLFANWRSSDNSNTQVTNTWMPYWALAIVSTALVYTHLTAVWIFVAELVFLVAHTIARATFGRSRKAIDCRNISFNAAAFLSTAVIFLVACVPAILQMVNVYQRKDNWQSISSIVHLWSEIWIPLALYILLPVIYLSISFVIGMLFSSKPNGGPSVESRTPIIWRSVFVLMWASIPAICVAIGDYFEISPMALHRYTVVGSVGFPVFAGLMTGSLSRSSIQVGLALLIILFSGMQNRVLQSAFKNHQRYVFRVEDWRSPINELNAENSKQGHPVFVFANVIEDAAAFSTNEKRFQEFLRFPTQGIYQIDGSGRQVISGPTADLTLAKGHFKDEHIALAKGQGGAWILVRGRLRMAEEIEYEFYKKSTAMFGEEISELRVSILETPESPVYLLSIDW